MASEQISDDVLLRAAERKIREAMAEGRFTALPGAGKPLAIEDDPYTPAEMRLASRALKNANALPEWMQLQRDVDSEMADLVRLRADIRREWERRGEAGTKTAPPWYSRRRMDMMRRMRTLNNLIVRMMLTGPSSAVAPPLFKPDGEIAAMDAEFGLEPEPMPQAVEESGPLRAAAQADYRAAKRSQ